MWQQHKYCWFFFVCLFYCIFHQDKRHWWTVVLVETDTESLSQAPEKLLLSACHLMVSITSTVRPVFLVTLPAVQNIFNLITTEGQRHTHTPEVNRPTVSSSVDGRVMTCCVTKLAVWVIINVFVCVFVRPTCSRLTCWYAGLCPTCCCFRCQTYQRTSSSGKRVPATTAACWQPSRVNIACWEGRWTFLHANQTWITVSIHPTPLPQPPPMVGFIIHWKWPHLQWGLLTLVWLTLLP